MEDNSYMIIQQNVDARQAVKFHDPETRARQVIGIQGTDVGEMTLVDEHEDFVAYLSSRTNDFEMVPESEDIEEAVVIRIHGEKSRLWDLWVAKEKRPIKLDTDGQVVLKGQALFGTLHVRDALDADRLSGRAPTLPYWIVVSTSRGALPALSIPELEEGEEIEVGENGG